MENLLTGLIVATLGVGVLLLALRRGSRWPLRVAQVSALIFAALATLLALQAERGGAGPHLHWMPDTEPVALVLDAPGIYLVALLYWMLALGTALPEGWIPHEGIAGLWPGLAHLLCGLVATALTIDHFLARIVLLDLVSLGVITLLCIDLLSLDHEFHVLYRYIIFRLGDMGLLLMVLLLWQASGTFLIKDMLQYAPALSAGQQRAAVLGGLLAACIKMGLPPFHGWVVDASALSPPRRLWLIGATLPLLGVYLLYRLQAMILNQSLAASLALLGTAIVVWSLRNVYRCRQAHTNPDVWWYSVHSALGLVLVGTPVMRLFLITFLPARVALCAILSRYAARAESTLAQQVCPARLKHWCRDLARAADLIETQIMARYPRLLAACVRALARAAGLIEAQIIARYPRLLAACVRALAQVSASHLERGLFDALVRWVAQAVGTAGTAMRQRHRGKLRHSLLWASIALIALLFVVFWPVW